MGQFWERKKSGAGFKLFRLENRLTGFCASLNNNDVTCPIFCFRFGLCDSRSLLTSMQSPCGYVNKRPKYDALNIYVNQFYEGDGKTSDQQWRSVDGI